MKESLSPPSSTPNAAEQSSCYDPLLNGLRCLLNEHGIELDAERLCFGIPLKNGRF